MGGGRLPIISHPHAYTEDQLVEQPAISPERYADWLGETWLQVLDNPDKASLEKIQKQPELF
jgi:hypothetical protein